MKTILWILPISLFAFLFLMLAKGLSLDPRLLPSTRVGQPLPEFNLPRLSAENETVSTQALLGHPFLLNVWASWCQACVEEQNLLLELSKTGVPIVGLNYKDKPQDARAWLSEWCDPYQLIMQDLQGRVAIDLGVYGAPETFVVDQQGKIRYRHVGVLDAQAWEKTIQPLLGQLQQEERG